MFVQFFFLMIRRPPRSTLDRSSAASDVYKRQISGCMRNVVGLYRAKEHYANLFVFIIAPAASGKGSLTFAKVLGDKFHDKLVAESTEKLKIHKIELQEYKRKINDKKQDTSELAPPDEPPFKVLFIPANNSSARVIQHLKEGDEQGLSLIHISEPTRPY